MKRSYINEDGYRQRRIPGHPNASPNGFVPEHRHNLEQKLGRPIKQGYHAHHIDGNKLNNKQSNLVEKSPSAHARIHAKQRKK